MKHRFRRGSAAFLLPLLFVVCLSTCSWKPAALYHPDIDLEMMRLAGLPDEEVPAYLRNLEREDIVSSYYRDALTKDSVLAFFGGIAGSEEIARIILDNAARYAVPPALAFALAYEESRFDTSARNDNGDSIDRGLFQLNSKSFPKLRTADFYDPAVNAKHGLAHLEYCLEAGGNEVAALAMYNAGHNRVSKGGTPKRTLDYIYRIQKYEENIRSLFAAKVASRSGARAASAPRR